MNNIVFLVRNVAPEKYGGGETYQLLLAEMLKKYGFRPYIITASQKLLKEAKKRKIDIVKSPYIMRQNWSGWRNILFPIYVLKQLRLRRWYRNILVRYKPSVINIQSRDDWIAATGVAKKMGVVVLWTDHMDFRSWVLENINKWYKNIIGKWVLKCAYKVDKIIMISDYERSCFERNVMPRKFYNLVTIKNGVVDKYKNFKNIKSKEKSVVYIGRIVDYKGIGELIEAFDAINKKYNKAILNIYGSGEDLKKYKEKAVFNERIIFHGQTDEPLEALAENEVFVLPSYREGLSLSLLDAAMMGKKIIASNVDGNSEIVINGKTGLLIPVRDVEKLVEAMINMIENREGAKKMALGARRYYEENFDFEKIFEEKMLPLYNIKKELK